MNPAISKMPGTLPAAITAILASPSAGPDAELIRICAEFTALQKQADAAYDAADETDDLLDERLEVDQRFWSKMRPRANSGKGRRRMSKATNRVAESRAPMSPNPTTFPCPRGPCPCALPCRAMADVLIVYEPYQIPGQPAPQGNGGGK
jgi:hypothetical protein